MQKSALVSTLLLFALSQGCVSQGKYDVAVQDATNTRRALVAANANSTAKDRELAALQRVLAETEARRARGLAELDSLKLSAQGCSKALDDAMAMNQQFRDELTRLGKDVDQLLSAKGAMATSLEQTRARLEELRRAQVAAESRAALYRDVALRLKRMVDAGELQIALRSGRMVLALSTDVLFDSGKTQMKPRGREALQQISAVLSAIPARRFQVAGHTDDEPIRFSGYASNWELSAARAVQVVQYLVQSGMRPETLSAAGYGEFDPVSMNDVPENKAQNRRIEITLQPNIDELVPLPVAK